jgi:preprotein translocase subunit SecF
VVFDKVRENTRSFTTNTKSTYAELANLAVNQTLVRSINTSVTALLPVAALLFVGVVIVGTGPLKDLALSLFVGMAAGAYSSIFIATPLAVQLKERDAPVQAQAQRVQARRDREQGKDTPGGPVAGGDAVPAGGAGRGPGGSTPAGSGPAGSPLGGGPAAPVPSGASAAGAKPAATPATRPTRSSAGRSQPQRRPRSQRGKGQR